MPGIRKLIVLSAFNRDSEGGLTPAFEPRRMKQEHTAVYVAQTLVNELWQRHQPAVLLVTHDVEESLLLADRVLIVDGGRIAYDERFDLERPRRRDHPDLVSRRRELLERLGVDDDR